MKDWCRNRRRIWKNIIDCYISLIVALFPISLFSQVDTAWVRRYDGPTNGSDVLTSMKIDNSGNVYVTGWSEGEHYEDYATIKYSAQGDELWVRRYNHPYNGNDCAFAVTVDQSLNVYVTGLAKSAYLIATIKYDSTGNELWVDLHEPPYWDNSGTDIMVDSEGYIYVAAFCVNPEAQYRVIKYHPAGYILWLREYLDPYKEFPILGIDNQNDIFIAGGTWRNYPSSEYLVIKYDENGQELWKRFYNGPGDSTDFIKAIVVDDSGNVYVTGQSMGTGSGYDYATIKYDNDGNQLWVARYNGPGNGDDRANAIAVDKIGNVYVTGGSEGDYVTIKYDSNGLEQWIVRYDGPGNGSDEATSIAVDGYGNVYVTGKSEGSGTGYDYATVKYDSAGIEQWVMRYNGPGDGSDEAVSIAVDGSNNVYVAGKSEGSGTGYDYATIKYMQEPGIEGDQLANLPQVDLKVSPNPFRDRVNIRCRMEDGRWNSEDISLRIYDATGRLVKEFIPPTASTAISWDGTDDSSRKVRSGVYFLRFEAGGYRKTKKLLLLR